MTNLVLASLRQLVRDLGAIEAKWALIGGLAVSARAEPRFTRDVDVSVLTHDDEEAEEIVAALGHRDYRVVAIVEQEETDRLATVRLASPLPAGVLVDLLFGSSGIEPELVAEAEALELLPDLVVPVARAGHLVILKLLARDDEVRPQDAVDLIALRPTLSPVDEADVRRLAGLVVERGFHRDRDLVALAAEYLSGR